MESGNIEINEMCKKAHDQAIKSGFWKDGRPISECLLLIITEICEIVEADRKEDEPNLREEIADSFIRLGDLVGALDFDIEAEITKKMKINEGRPIKHNKRY